MHIFSEQPKTEKGLLGDTFSGTFIIGSTAGAKKEVFIEFLGEKFKSFFMTIMQVFNGSFNVFV
ncbi:hypothetical protein D3C71_1253640 [compost metagenome]